MGGSRQVIVRTASDDASAGYWVRLPPSTYVDSIIPLYSIKGKGSFTPPQWCSRGQMELVSAGSVSIVTSPGGVVVDAGATGASSGTVAFALVAHIDPVIFRRSGR